MAAGARWGRFHPGAIPQIEALDARTEQIVRLKPGEADLWRQDTRAGHLLCPVLRPDGEPCGIAYDTTVSGGGIRRDHFRHAASSGAAHAQQSEETTWHLLAKRAIEEWAYRHYPDAQIEVEGQRLQAGKHGRQPDVRIVRDGLPIAAVEVCWSSPATGADWLQRHLDYRAADVHDVWLLTDTGLQGQITSTPGRNGRGADLRVTVTALAAEMIRNGVIPLWLHLPQDGPGSDGQVAKVGTPLAFRKVDGRNALVTPLRKDLQVGSSVLLGEAPLDQCRLADPPRSELITPQRRRQLEGDTQLSRARANTVRAPAAPAETVSSPPPPAPTTPAVTTAPSVPVTEQAAQAAASLTSSTPPPAHTLPVAPSRPPMAVRELRSPQAANSSPGRTPAPDWASTRPAVAGRRRSWWRRFLPGRGRQ